jgi:hypothetical protein
VPAIDPPIINNYINDIPPIINNYLPDNSALNEIIRLLTQSHVEYKNNRNNLGQYSAVQYSYHPPIIPRKTTSTNNSYCQAQPRSKESFTQTYSKTATSKKEFKVTINPIIRNYVATPNPPNILVKPTANKIHIHPKFSFKNTKKVYKINQKAPRR